MPTSSYSSTEPQKPTIKPQHSNFEDTLTLKSTLAFLSQKKRQSAFNTYRFLPHPSFLVVRF